MNPINIFQMMKAGPQQFIQQMMGNNQIMSNPMMKNTMQMAQQGNMQGIEQMTFYYAWLDVSDEYRELVISDTPHEELGLNDD